MSSRVALALLVALSATGSLSSVRAQATARITGTITDTSGSIVPSAVVTVTSESTGVKSEAVSNANGNYTVLFLAPGAYRISVEKESFRRVDRPGIQLQVAQAVEVNFQLELGTIVQSVTIVDSAPLLDASTNAIGGVVSSDKIENDPMKGRNSSAFMALVPGVLVPRGTASQPVLESHYQFFSISGGRPGQNQFLLDGGNDSDVGYNGPEYTASVETVQEYRVQTNNYSAEYANFQGGVINIVTKGGTNQFHGDMFEYLRNNVFEANGFFVNLTGTPRPSLKMNQFGGTLGGPIKKNRTFFFAGVEALRFLIPAGGAGSAAGLPTVTSVPTALQRQGDFSATRAANGTQITMYDPVSIAPGSPSTAVRTPFPGNMIPSSRFNPVSVAVLQYIPSPNTAGNPITGLNNYQISASENESDNNVSFRLDHRLNDGTSLMGRYSESFNNTRLPNVYGNIADPYNSDTIEHHASGVVTLNKIFSPTFLGEFLGSWNRFTYNIGSAGTGYDPVKLGMPAYLAANAQVPGFPQFTIASMTNIGYYSSSHDTWDRAEFRGNLTKTRGNHTFKFGGIYGAAQLFGSKNNNYDGTYGFTQQFTQGPNPLLASTTAGFGFASFVIGVPTSGTYHPTSENAADIAKYFGFYFQEEYKATKRLTLNLGLRWDDEMPRTERYNRIPNWNFAGAATLSNGTPITGGIEFPGTGGLARGQWRNNTHDFGPRVGLAYMLTANTVVRAGYGIFFGNSFGSGDNANQVPNTGFGCSTSVNASIDGGITPAATISNPFPNGLCQPTGSSAGLATALGTSVFVISRDFKMLYTQAWSLDIQRRLPKDVLVQVVYTGTRGLHLPGEVSLNQLNPSYLSLASQLNSAVPNPFVGVITQGTLSVATITRAQSLLPYPQYLNVTNVFNTYGASTYNALSLKVEHRFAHGFSILGSYTFSKIIDDVVASPTGFAGDSFTTGAIQNYYNTHADRSIAGFNIPHNITVSYVYELPFGPGKALLNTGGIAGKLVGGWQINGITTFRSGTPLQISGGNTSALNAGTLRPNWNGQNPTLSGSVTSRLNAYFNTSDFSLNPLYTFGNVPRIMPDLYGPGTADFGISLFKNTQFRERWKLQFRAEAFNAFNRVQFGNLATNITLSTFGQITTQANLARDIQLALKLMF
jgi:hypothetical protein